MRVARLPRWLLSLLAVLLVAGHACEWPAYAGASRSSHEAQHAPQPDGHHHGDQEVACDAVEALASTARADASGPVNLIASLPTAATVALPRAVRVPDDTRPPIPRPPLFLLHATLLI